MRKLLIIYGVIGGLLLSAKLFLSIPAAGAAMDFEQSNTRNYLLMTAAFTLIIIATGQINKRYFDNAISFWKALVLGLNISLIMVLIYTLSWELILNQFIPNYSEQYLEYTITKIESSSLSDALKKQRIEMVEMSADLYETNILYRLGTGFLEVFPVALLISLLSALLFGKILRRK